MKCWSIAGVGGCGRGLLGGCSPSVALKSAHWKADIGATAGGAARQSGKTACRRRHGWLYWVGALARVRQRCYTCSGPRVSRSWTSRGLPTIVGRPLGQSVSYHNPQTRREWQHPLLSYLPAHCAWIGGDVSACVVHARRATPQILHPPLSLHRHAGMKICWRLPSGGFPPLGQCGSSTRASTSERAACRLRCTAGCSALLAECLL